MTELRITGLKLGNDQIKGQVGAKNGSTSFDDVLQDAVGKISQVQQHADAAVKELASGGDITQALISMEKADMSFQLMIEVRNRLLSAYEEISRMQV
jgi:flagellar hook-basal body complex protein FliE